MSAEDSYFGNEMPSMRLPPHSIEAEQSLLGGLMLDNNAWDRISDLISEQDIYRSEHRQIFNAIASLLERGKTADVVTVWEALKSSDRDEKIGGLAYLSEIANNTASTANIRRYAEIVKERSIKRKLITTGDEIAASGFENNGREVAAILDEAESMILSIRDSGIHSKTTVVPIQSVLGQCVDRIQELYDRDDPNALTGIGTGLIDLDNITQGLQPSDMIVIAGRPGMGKTSFALNIAEHVAVELGLPVLIFTMEMPATQLANKIISSVGNIRGTKLRKGNLDDSEWQKLTYALGRLHEAPIYIDESSGLNSIDLRSRARRVYRDCGKLGLIVIDYLQLMTSLRKTDNRAGELSEISRNVKNLAKELNVPILALSQLNRSLESRTNKRPVMSDLKESGAIEQDADVIMFIYRDEIYDPSSEERGTAEIILGKHRNGETGTVRTGFHAATTRFSNLAHNWKSQQAPMQYESHKAPKLD